MNPKKAYNYFRSKFELHESTKGWYRFEFPLDVSHRDISAGVNFRLNAVKDHRTGYKSGIIKFVARYEEIGYIEAKRLIETFDEVQVDLDYYIPSKFKTSSVTLPNGFKSILEGDGVIANRARKYLLSRGFNLEILDSLGFGYVSESGDEFPFYGYIIIPFKADGLLVYYIGRDFVGNWIKYRNPEFEDVGIGKSDLIFNQDALYIYDEVFLTEGWADAMTIGDTGIASLGWSLSQSQKNIILKSPCKIINIIPDRGILKNELSFYQKAKQIAMALMPHKKVRIINVDIENLPGKDVNEYGAEIILDLVKKTEFITYSNLLKI